MFKEKEEEEKGMSGWKTGLELFQASRLTRRLSFGCATLDATLGGGISQYGITEIAGEAGCGKSQCCLTLALQCLLDEADGGLRGATAYLSCGEGTFPIRRLEQMAQVYARKYSAQGKRYEDFLDNVKILECHSTEHAQETLNRQLPDMCRENNIRLLVIDSMAGLVRTEFDSSSCEEMKLRTAALFKLSRQLKWLADTYRLCIVVVNQVTAIFDGGGGGGGSGASFFASGGNDTTPALGLAWAHCVNTRIMLRRDATKILSIGGGADHSNGSGGGGGETWKYGDDGEEQENAKPRDQNGQGNSHGGRGSSSGSGAGGVGNITAEGPGNGMANGTIRSKRFLTCEFSPGAPRASCGFVIEVGGVLGIAEGGGE